MRRVIVLTTLGVLALISAGVADEPKLAKAKLILADDGPDELAKFTHSARLSPDGRYLLYVRVKQVAWPADGGGPARQQRSYRLILRDLKSGKDKPLPIPAYLEDFVLMPVVSGNVFDLGGRKIALGVAVDANGDGLHDYRTEKMQAVVYDIASDKLAKQPVIRMAVVPTFDRTGNGLIITAMGHDAENSQLLTTPLGKPKLRQLGKWGLPRGVCPTAQVLAMLTPPNGVFPPSRYKFVLYDLKADKQITEMPTHEKCNMLSQYCPQWTADGRYLYYADVKLEMIDGRQERKYLTRIWDRTKGREAGIVPDVVPIGPGPGKSTMVVAKDRGRGQMSLHDAATGDSHTLGKETMTAIAAEGKYLLYADKPADGKSGIYMAEIVAAKKDKPAGKKETEAKPRPVK